MARFRATIWTLSAQAEAAMGDEGIARRVIEDVADSEDSFKAVITDEFCRHPDDQIWFGPVSEKKG